MNSFASSASPDLVHWHEETPVSLIAQAETQIEQSFQKALIEARQIVVSAGYSLSQLADKLGIKHFDHQISCDLTGCRLVLQPHGHLEIHREGAKHATSFPVVLRSEEEREVTA